MVAIAASGALPLVSPNGTGGVCLSQMVAMVVLGVLPPFHRMVHASYAYRERSWLRSGRGPPIDNHYSDNYAHGKATACYRYKWTPIKPYIPPKWLVTRV